MSWCNLCKNNRKIKFIKNGQKAFLDCPLCIEKHKKDSLEIALWNKRVDNRKQAKHVAN